jgi:DNA-directed RNA polymerase specialized sigma24 family protein
MRQSISQDDLRTLLHEADVAVRRLVRKLGLPRADLDDIRQDLLTDALARLHAFDAERGALGAFVGLVMANRATRIAQRVRNHRRMYGPEPVSLDEPVAPGSRETLGASMPEEQSLAAIQGHWVNPIAQVERRLDLERGLGTLDEKGRRLVADLLRGSAHWLARAGLGSRSTLYRQTRELRLALMAVGVSAV